MFPHTHTELHTDWQTNKPAASPHWTPSFQSAICDFCKTKWRINVHPKNLQLVTNSFRVFCSYSQEGTQVRHGSCDAKKFVTVEFIKLLPVSRTGLIFCVNVCACEQVCMYMQVCVFAYEWVLCMHGFVCLTHLIAVLGINNKLASYIFSQHHSIKQNSQLHLNSIPPTTAHCHHSLHNKK